MPGPGDRFTFGPFELDARTRRLTRGGDIIQVSSRLFDVLHVLVASAGEVITKDRLIEAAWDGLAVTDNSIEQAISALRRTLGTMNGRPFIETHTRRGYSFAADIARLAAVRESDAALDALLAPHRAWIEGRAALETLEREQVVRARAVFERVLAQIPEQATAHVGLANACIMQYEMTRSDRSPDADALAVAMEHAREACRLDPGYGEGWATLGFVLDRTGRHDEAIAAGRRAIALETDNWRHHVRLSYISWGEERLREARRALALLPGFPLAHWLAATVHVARQAFAEAERELAEGLAAQPIAAQTSGLAPSTGVERFSSVALHWLSGLIALARGDAEAARRLFDLELRAESSGHLYARECAANTWYAIGTIHLRRGEPAAARRAFEEALTRVEGHALARAGLSLLEPASHQAPSDLFPTNVDQLMTMAAQLVAAGRHADAATLVDRALALAPPGSLGWLLPVEPLLAIAQAPDAWAPVLARLRMRAA